MDNKTNINAIILAAGFGKRTEGILKQLPKTLIVTKDGQTILDHLLNEITTAFRFSTISIISNNKYHKLLENHLRNEVTYKNIRLYNDGRNNADERLGALGDLKFAFDSINANKGKYFIFPSDYAFWHSFRIKDFINFSLKQKEHFTTIVRNVKDPKIIEKRFGCAVLNDKNEIIHFLEKPVNPLSPLAATPFYKFENSHRLLLQQYISDGGNPDSPGNFIPYHIRKGQTIKAMIIDNDIIDVGTPADIEEAKKY